MTLVPRVFMYGLKPAASGRSVPPGLLKQSASTQGRAPYERYSSHPAAFVLPFLYFC